MKGSGTTSDSSKSSMKSGHDLWRQASSAIGYSLHFLFLANADTLRGWSSLIKIDTYIYFPGAENWLDVCASLHLVSSSLPSTIQRRDHVFVVRTSGCGKRMGLSFTPCSALGVCSASSALNSHALSSVAVTGPGERESDPRSEFRMLVYSQERCRFLLLGFCFLSSYIQCTSIPENKDHTCAW